MDFARICIAVKWTNPPKNPVKVCSVNVQLCTQYASLDTRRDPALCLQRGLHLAERRQNHSGAVANACLDRVTAGSLCRCGIWPFIHGWHQAARFFHDVPEHPSCYASVSINDNPEVCRSLQQNLGTTPIKAPFHGALKDLGSTLLFTATWLTCHGCVPFLTPPTLLGWFHSPLLLTPEAVPRSWSAGRGESV